MVIEEHHNDEGELESITFNSFTSNPDNYFKVSAEELVEHFEVAIVNKDGFIVGLRKYPDGKIHASEFKKRADVKNIAALVHKGECAISPLRASARAAA